MNKEANKILRNIRSFHKEAREGIADEEHDVGGQQYIGIDFVLVKHLYQGVLMMMVAT